MMELTTQLAQGSGSGGASTKNLPIAGVSANANAKRDANACSMLSEPPTYKNKSTNSVAIISASALHIALALALLNLSLTVQRPTVKLPQVFDMRLLFETPPAPQVVAPTKPVAQKIIMPPVAVPLLTPLPEIQLVVTVPLQTPRTITLAPAAPTPPAQQGELSSQNDASATKFLTAVNEKIALPASDADYLNNPAPKYPAISKKLGEEGKVLLSVLVNPDGRVAKVSLKTSSGFDRLDQAALNAVTDWRFSPGTRNGVAQQMWVTVPINFALR